MPNKSDVQTLLLCSGKHCLKKQRSAYLALERVVAEADISFATVDCLGTCSGPIAAVASDGELRCFEDLRSSKTHGDLVSYAIRSTKRPSKRLRKRELTGKKQKKAKKRIAAAAS